MTQEDKELLLKDLSARLPFGVKFSQNDSNSQLILSGIWSNAYGTYAVPRLFGAQSMAYRDINIEHIKPYLRPMSSMSKGEFDKYEELEWDGDFEHLSLPLLDWLNKKMFDYRGLIELGLALEALDGMYDLKEK